MIVTEQMRRQRTQPKLRRTSMRRVSRTGEPAPSWRPQPKLSTLANECFRACLNPHAKADLIRVFVNNGDYQGRCYTEQRIITLSKNGGLTLKTLAHEIAHLRFKSHGKKHEELAAELLKWLETNYQPE